MFAKRQASLKKYETLKICAPVARHMSNTAETDVKVDGSLPDQLINPGDYESLLPTKAEHTAADYTENKKKLVNNDSGRLTPVYKYGSIN